MNDNKKMFSTNKEEIYVGFSKDAISSHSTISGLKYYLIIMYFRKHLDTFGEISFTLNKLLNECGYSTKSHNDNIYKDFRNIIQNEIIDKGFASSHDNIQTTKPNALYTLQLLPSKSLFISSTPYISINVDEFDSIVNIPGCKINRSVLFGVYMYIKQFIYTDLQRDKYSRLSYPKQQQMAKDLGISSITTIEKAINILEKNNLIHVQRDLFVEDKKGIYLPARNVYTLKKEDLKLSTILLELEAFYGKHVCTKFNVDGEIKYIKT